VLGQSQDPRLPDGFADLVYMNRVFHHFAQPQAMLERLWFDLKPGGFLVIVDREKGPLTHWAPVARREKEHHWTGETTVVRVAREAGFLFHDGLKISGTKTDRLCWRFKNRLRRCRRRRILTCHKFCQQRRWPTRC